MSSSDLGELMDETTSERPSASWIFELSSVGADCDEMGVLVFDDLGGPRVIKLDAWDVPALGLHGPVDSKTFELQSAF